MKTTSMDHAILLLAMKPRAYADFATMLPVVSSYAPPPEELPGHIARLEKAGYLNVEQVQSTRPGNQSIISITQSGDTALRNFNLS